MAAPGNRALRPARGRIENADLRFRRSRNVGCRLFASLFSLHWRLRPSSVGRRKGKRGRKGLIPHKRSSLKIRVQNLAFIARGVAALVVQSQLAEYGQLAPTGHGWVVCPFHIGEKIAVAAQAAGDWIPGRRWYPGVHCKCPAWFCLNIADDRNRNSRGFIGPNRDKRGQIGKDGDGLDTRWLMMCCSSLKVLNELLFLLIESTVRNICSNGVKKFPIHMCLV